MAIAYSHDGNLYLALTNRCPTSCAFCVKTRWKGRFQGYELALKREPGLGESFAAARKLLARLPKADEVVFCGFGEPTYQLPQLVALSMQLRREFPRLRRRLNTVGLGNLIWGRDIAVELAGALEAVSVSLNTSDPKQWQRLMRPAPEFAQAGFDAVVRFIADCVGRGLDTTVTAVQLPGVDLKSVRALAAALGARFRERPVLVRSRREPKPAGKSGRALARAARV